MSFRPDTSFASHLASAWAMAALVMAIATFGFVMLAWLSAADNR